MFKIAAATLVAFAALMGGAATQSPASADTVVYCNADGEPSGCVAAQTSPTVIVPPRPRAYYPVVPRPVDVYRAPPPPPPAATPAGRAARAAGPGVGRNYGGPVNRPGRF